jgi:integrase/recombinase XerC
VTFCKPRGRPISGEEEQFLLEFAHFLSGVRSPASIAAYQSDIRLFVENTPGVDLLRMTNKQEDDYIAGLQALGFKRRTLSRKGTAFRYFRKFLSRFPPVEESLGQGAESHATVDQKLGSATSVFTQSNNIDTALSGFVSYLRENRSQATVRAYTCDLLKFRECLQESTAWDHVSKQLIEDFISQQIVSGLNVNSTARLLSTIRSLFGWLQQNGHLTGNPSLLLRAPRGRKQALRLSRTDLEVMALANLPSEFPVLRNLLIFELLYRCGLRVSEISSLNIASVNLKRRRLMIQGRRSRERYIHLSESLIRLLPIYLLERQKMGENNAAPLVVNLRGGRLTDRSIGRVVKRLAILHKLPEETHPHTLRDAFAAHSLKTGRDVQDIRHDLGVSGVSAVLKISN